MLCARLKHGLNPKQLRKIIREVNTLLARKAAWRRRLHSTTASAEKPTALIKKPLMSQPAI
jgi:hypothetical protein